MGLVMTPRDLLAMLKRRFVVICVILGLGLIVSYMAAMRLPRFYESVAVLQVELPAVSAEVASGDAMSRSSQRLQLLEQELLSRDALLGLVAQHGLFTDFPAMTDMEKVLVMRRSIRIETVRSTSGPFGGEQPVSALLIVTQLGDRLKAAAVANDLAQKVLETTAQRRSVQVRETLEFYASQEERVGMAIAGLEAEITAYKNANIDALPESMQARIEEVARVEGQLQTYDLQLLALRQELAALTEREAPRVIEQRQIASLRAQIAGVEEQRQTAMDRRAQVQAAIASAPSVETQLGTFQRRLAQLQEQYSVITARRAAAETSQRLDSERQTERFELLEEAVPADYPQNSGRKKMMVLGGGISLALALALAYLLELRNPVLRSARQLERVLQIRPVIALPVLPAVKRKGRGQRKRGGGGMGVMRSLFASRG